MLRRYYAPSWPNGQLPAAPENLAQAVLPGWNFGTIVNVSEENSAAPETELAILRTQSYGRQLGQISDALQVLITESEKRGYRQMVAVIGDSANAASIGVHTRAGFKMVGTFENVGFKFDRWLDSVLMQRALGEGATTKPR